MSIRGVHIVDCSSRVGLDAKRLALAKGFPALGDAYGLSASRLAGESGSRLRAVQGLTPRLVGYGVIVEPLPEG